MLLLAAGPLDWLIDPFTGSVTMQRALLAGTFVAVSCGLVGTWAVLRGTTFIGDALAHGVLPGLALASVVGFSPTLGALGSAAVMIGGITVVGRRARLGEDAAIGLLFVGMLALGVLIVSRSRTFAGDLTTFLFGSITSVSVGDLRLAAAVAVLAVVVVVLGHRAFLMLCFNPQAARLAGLHPGWAHAVLLVLVTLAVVGSFSTVGTLLVFAMLTAPAAAAIQLVRRVPLVLVTAVAIAQASVVTGLLLSWYHRLAAGAAMALTAVGAFVVSLAVAELRGALAHRRAAVTPG